jgi:hypothetical protein
LLVALDHVTDAGTWGDRAPAESSPTGSSCRADARLRSTRPQGGRGASRGCPSRRSPTSSALWRRAGGRLLAGCQRARRIAWRHRSRTPVRFWVPRDRSLATLLRHATFREPACRGQGWLAERCQAVSVLAYEWWRTLANVTMRVLTSMATTCCTPRPTARCPTRTRWLAQHWSPTLRPAQAGSRASRCRRSANPGSDGARNVAGVIVLFSPYGSDADAVIEALAWRSRERGEQAAVVTSDAATQWSGMGEGVSRMSAAEFTASLEADSAAWREHTPSGSRKVTLDAHLGSRQAGAVLEGATRSHGIGDRMPPEVARARKTSSQVPHGAPRQIVSVSFAVVDTRQR